MGELLPHQQFEYAAELAELKPNPDLLARLLYDLSQARDEIAKSAASSLRSLNLGFYALTVCENPRIQLNFFKPGLVGRNDIHMHGATQRTTFYGPPKSLLEVTNYRFAADGTLIPDSELTGEHTIWANHDIDHTQDIPGTKGPYNLKRLGHARLSVDSAYLKPPLSIERTAARQLHHVEYLPTGPQVAVSVQYRLEDEPPEMSDTLKGLVEDKGIPEKFALEILEQRRAIHASIAAGDLGDAVLNSTGIICVDETLDHPYPGKIQPPPLASAHAGILGIALDVLDGGYETVTEIATGKRPQPWKNRREDHGEHRM